MRLAVFAGYAEPPLAWSVAPWSAFMTHHACSTAYWSAATRIEETPDVYIAISSPGQDPATRPLPRNIGAFPVDPYEYPPTFLLAPRALAAVTPEFVAFRHVWLLLNAVLVIAGMAVIARSWMRRRAGARCGCCPWPSCPSRPCFRCRWATRSSCTS